MPGIREGLPSLLLTRRIQKHLTYPWSVVTSSETVQGSSRSVQEAKAMDADTGMLSNAGKWQ